MRCSNRSRYATRRTSISADLRCNAVERANASSQLLQETSTIGIAFELHEAEAGGSVTI